MRFDVLLDRHIRIFLCVCECENLCVKKVKRGVRESLLGKKGTKSHKSFIIFFSPRARSYIKETAREKREQEEEEEEEEEEEHHSPPHHQHYSASWLL